MKIETWTWQDTLWGIWCFLLLLVAVLAIFPGWAAVGRLLETNAAPAWVQAVGSVGAILVAVWVSHAQERRSALRAATQAVLMTRSFAGLLAAACQRAIEVAPVNSFSDLQTVRAVIDEVMITGRSINAEQLSLEWAGAIYGLRSVGVQMSEYLRHIKPEDLHGLWGNKTVDLFIRHLTSIAELTEIVRCQHPGIPVPRTLAHAPPHAGA